MKKKITRLGLFVLLAIIIAVSIVSFSQSGYAINKGMWVYNTDNGTHKGCVSPGNDCTWSSSIPVQ